MKCCECNSWAILITLYFLHNFWMGTIRFFQPCLVMGLTHKHKTRLERIARDKHASLLGPFISYVKVVMSTAPCLLANIRPAWKGLPGTNTLAYFEPLTVRESVTTFTSGAKAIDLLQISKDVCIQQPFEPSPLFVGWVMGKYITREEHLYCMMYSRVIFE